MRLFLLLRMKYAIKNRIDRERHSSSRGIPPPQMTKFKWQLGNLPHSILILITKQPPYVISKWRIQLSFERKFPQQHRTEMHVPVLC